MKKYVPNIVLIILHIVCYVTLAVGCGLIYMPLAFVVPALLLWLDLALEAHYARNIQRTLQ